ncbi:MAG: asparagine synthase (glutamine-hydrolyzing), partial [Pirellula sp.]|nr:asparagine synthase (glutamine-hydrolyzing) [Pirellula sp.]
MCGIYGRLIHAENASSHAIELARIADAMSHRGPDAWDSYCDAAVSLVHTRLSLVDLESRANQPMWDQSGRYCIVYNGELYDYREVRKDLERRGIRFVSTTDTEVLLYAIIEWGLEEALQRVDGMYAFAVYDRVERKLQLARDRVGMKPLFYIDQSDAFAFASSIQALQVSQPLSPNLLSVQSFLLGYGGPMSGNSFFCHVEQIPPGHVLTIQQHGSATVRRFASWRDLSCPATADALGCQKPEQWVDQLGEFLEKSVASQLVADADVGTLCSGGVDSSLVLAIAKRFKPDIQAFHANVVGSKSELAAAQQVASDTNVPLHVVDVHDRDFIDLVPEVTEHYGLPFLFHPNAVPFIQVSKLVRQCGVKAVLCGEGADELFLGYEWLIPNIRRTLTRAPAQLFQLSKSAFDHFERWIRGKPTRYTDADWDLNLVRSLPHRMEYELGVDDDFDKDLLSRYPRTADHRRIDQSGQLSYILRSLMHRNDSLGMSASIEARYPLLSRDILRLAINLPTRAKLRWSSQMADWHHPFVRDKWVLRKLAERYLPRPIAHRVKRPFLTTALDRMHIPPGYFDDSLLAEWF